MIKPVKAGVRTAKSHSSRNSGYIPVRPKWPLRPPIPSINNQVHLSLSAEQVSNLLDCLFYTASEANPAAFRKKAWAMIHLVQCTPGYQVMTFEREGEEDQDER